MKHVLFLCVLSLLAACNSASIEEKKEARRPATTQEIAYAEEVHRLLSAKHQLMPAPESGDWLSLHKEEGQTFPQYMKARQPDANIAKKWLIILPIGEFDKERGEIFKKAVEYLGTFYQLQTRVLPTYPVSKIPKKAIRPNQFDFQLHTGYVLDELLLPQMRDSIACLLAFTAHDLYPYPSWNFVFGQASLEKRMGVWSLNRFGNPAQDEESYRLCLMHTLKTAIHEAGHIFGIKHCTRYSCCMSGSNGLWESAKHPVMFCPVCTAKVGAHFKMDLAKQHKQLADFWRRNNFPDEQRYYEDAGKALERVRLPTF